jgi:hypothetical protein
LRASKGFADVRAHMRSAILAVEAKPAFVEPKMPAVASELPQDESGV